MRPNPLRDKFGRNETAFGAWLTIPNSFSAETTARVGFDYVCVDMQHGMIGYDAAFVMLQALGLGTTTATIRVPWNEPGIIGKVLDSGAMAVIVPMVNTEQQTREALACGHYAPAGARSSGPTRVAPHEGADYVDLANEHTMIIPMVETVEAMSNLDNILSTPGLEAIYVGPADLAVSMGLPRGSADSAFLASLDEIVAACGRHGIVPGIHANPGNVRDMVDRGFRMVTAQTELIAMRTGLVEALAIARSGTVQDEGASGGY